jgi:hypothetical protein
LLRPILLGGLGVQGVDYYLIDGIFNAPDEVSIILISCKSSSLIWGIGALALFPNYGIQKAPREKLDQLLEIKPKLNSSSSRHRIFESAQRNPELARSASGRMEVRLFSKHIQNEVSMYLFAQLFILVAHMGTCTSPKNAQ